MNNNQEDIIRRANRKDEHIQLFLEHLSKTDIKSRAEIRNSNGFEDIVLQNNALPELDFAEIETSWHFAGKQINAPLMINAMTGGTAAAMAINEKLAYLANRFNIPIAVGSQTIALHDGDRAETFQIMRDINKEGVVIANLSANSTYDNAVKAMDMLNADALQLHLNIAQELCMPEGDRNFRGILENIKQIVSSVEKPVIVKEVGFGISFETASKLFEAGVRYIDIGGKGGTNFVEIENARNQERDFSFLNRWGIKTALSLLESRNVSSELHLICTGGMRTAEEAVKAVCMGADLVGISGGILSVLLNEGLPAAEKMIEDMLYEMRVFMLLLGAQNIKELKKVVYLLKGETRELWHYKYI